MTRRQEVGGSIFLNVYRFSGCSSSYSNGQITGKSCSAITETFLGLGGFYRYYFAKEGAKGFPFVGAELSVQDVGHPDFSGNISLRPQAGYRYFLTKNVALDFSARYSIGLNKVAIPGFTQTRSQSLSGGAGLAFIF